MKNHKEMVEALLAKKTLIDIDNIEYRLCCNMLIRNHNKLINTWEYTASLPSYEFVKLKLETININGTEIPKPIRKIYEYIPYYVVAFPNILCLYKGKNEVSETILDLALIEGRLHISFENAKIHQQALLSFTKIGE